MIKQGFYLMIQPKVEQKHITSLYNTLEKRVENLSKVQEYEERCVICDTLTFEWCKALIGFKGEWEVRCRDCQDIIGGREIYE